MKKSIKFIASVLAVGALAAGIHSNVQAHNGVHMNYDQGDVIRITKKNDLESTMYYVNGKEFSWNDLSAEQQNRIRKVDAKLTKAEQEFDKQESKISQLTTEIEKKAHLIEAEAAKIEKAVVKISKKEMNLRDLEHAMRELEISTRANEIALRTKELELDKLDDKLDAIDLSMVREIEQHAEEYEELLIEIARELK